MDFATVTAIALATLAAGSAFYAVFYPHLSGDIKAEKRQAALKSTLPKRSTADRANDVAQRRKQVSDSLKEVDSRKKKKLTLEAKLAQAGMDWDRRRFYIMSTIPGVLTGFVTYVVSDNILIALAGLVIGGVGLPAYILRFLRNRRLKKFVNEFPNAVDIIIRGIKAGLPLGDCLRIIASEISEPVKGEFRRIVEAQTMGLSIGEAVEKIAERVPIAETSFFSIVINIQQKAGGNLSEALSNLSTVLRERKKMKSKVKAMSAEAKASASIIGALPFTVATFVYITSPDYISLLWTTTTGLIVLAVSACWMAAGIFVMKKMINFDM